MHQPDDDAAVGKRARRDRPCSLVKIGGSLLDLPDLTARLGALLDQLDRPVALLVGGGPAADAVRKWATVFEIGESVSHWLAIDSLSLTARLVCELLNRDGVFQRSGSESAVIVDHWPAACDAVERGLIPLLNPRGLLASVDDQPGIQLPESWVATSDSIAASIAIQWSVPQLILCKSVDVPPNGLLAELATGPTDSLPVDDWFGHLAPQLGDIQWCNLRSSAVRCVPWRPL